MTNVLAAPLRYIADAVTYCPRYTRDLWSYSESKGLVAWRRTQIGA